MQNENFLRIAVAVLNLLGNERIRISKWRVLNSVEFAQVHIFRAEYLNQTLETLNLELEYLCQLHKTP